MSYIQTQGWVEDAVNAVDHTVDSIFGAQNADYLEAQAKARAQAKATSTVSGWLSQFFGGVSSGSGAADSSLLGISPVGWVVGIGAVGLGLFLILRKRKGAK